MRNKQVFIFIIVTNLILLSCNKTSNAIDDMTVIGATYQNLKIDNRLESIIRLFLAENTDNDLDYMLLVDKKSTYSAVQFKIVSLKSEYFEKNPHPLFYLNYDKQKVYIHQNIDNFMSSEPRENSDYTDLIAKEWRFNLSKDDKDLPIGWTSVNKDSTSEDGIVYEIETSQKLVFYWQNATDLLDVREFKNLSHIKSSSIRTRPHSLFVFASCGTVGAGNYDDYSFAVTFADFIDKTKDSSLKEGLSYYKITVIGADNKSNLKMDGTVRCPDGNFFKIEKRFEIEKKAIYKEVVKGIWWWQETTKVFERWEVSTILVDTKLTKLMKTIDPAEIIKKHNPNDTNI